MAYRVEGWFGRTGNNIQQVTNALLLAEHRQENFSQFLDHNIIDKFSVNFGGSDDVIEDGRFYSWEPLFSHENVFVGDNEIGLDKEYIYKNFKRVCETYVTPNLKIPKVDVLPEDTVVIHIRSGDIFERIHIPPISYVPNPLDYYLNIIDKFENVIVVTEPDKNNPIIFELQKNKKVIFQSKTVQEDFATLMSARNLVLSGVGTFAMAAAMCSSNIESLYTTNLLFTEHLNYSMMFNTSVNVNVTKLNDYIPVYPCSWTNTEEQRNFILTYQI
jgi:rhodanese-related sulfurtransferase